MAPPDLFSVLRKWLPYTVAGQRRANDTDPALSALLKHPGLQSIALDENVQPVLGAARMLSGDSLLPDDHMVRCHCVHLYVWDPTHPHKAALLLCSQLQCRDDVSTCMPSAAGLHATGIARCGCKPATST